MPWAAASVVTTTAPSPLPRSTRQRAGLQRALAGRRAFWRRAGPLLPPRWGHPFDLAPCRLACHPPCEPGAHPHVSKDLKVDSEATRLANFTVCSTNVKLLPFTLQILMQP